jgi:hypothetical protein
MGGGFGFYFTGGAVAGSGGTGWGAPPVFLNSVQQGLGLNGQQLAGILYMDKMQLDGEMLFDAGGLFPLLSGPGHFEIKEMLTESVNTTVMRFNTGNNTAGNIVIINPTMADQTGGQATPMYDFTNAQSVAGITFNNPSCNSGPLVAAGPNLFFEYNSSPFAGCGAGMSGGILKNVGGAGSLETLINYPLLTNGTGILGYQMSAPGTPAGSAIGGGTLTAGTYQYKIMPVDAVGNYGTLSPASTGVTVSGSQQVSLSFTLTPGQASSVLCRNFNGGSFNCATAGPAQFFKGNMFIDNQPSFAFAGGPPSNFTAAASEFNSAGVAAPQISILGGSYANSVAGTFTATRATTLPDASGIVPVSSYLNSAFDNATRANGAIGANWSVVANGLNIASNQIQGTTAAVNNAAYWNTGASFAPDQFSQAIVTALNGTTDFPEVAVRISGTSSSTLTAYICTENSTTFFIGKIVNGVAGNFSNTAVSGAVGDVIRTEIQGTTQTCYRNGAVILTNSGDTTVTAGQPGININGNVATLKNWSGGNLHPLSQLDVEADYTKPQHLLANGGTCTMSAGTTCSITLPEQPATLTRCLVTQQGTGTPVAAECSISGTTLTITAASSNSATWAAFIF